MRALTRNCATHALPPAPPIETTRRIRGSRRNACARGSLQKHRPGPEVHSGVMCPSYIDQPRGALHRGRPNALVKERSEPERTPRWANARLTTRSRLWPAVQGGKSECPRMWIWPRFKAETLAHHHGSKESDGQGLARSACSTGRIGDRTACSNLRGGPDSCADDGSVFWASRTPAPLPVFQAGKLLRWFRRGGGTSGP